jgi:hypothetical protein
VIATRIGGFVQGNKVESGMLKKRQERGSAKLWFIGLVIVILLVIGGVEVNPGPQAEQTKIDQTSVRQKAGEEEQGDQTDV